MRGRSTSPPERDKHERRRRRVGRALLALRGGRRRRFRRSARRRAATAAVGASCSRARDRRGETYYVADHELVRCENLNPTCPDFFGVRPDLERALDQLWAVTLRKRQEQKRTHRRNCEAAREVRTVAMTWRTEEIVSTVAMAWRGLDLVSEHRRVIATAARRDLHRAAAAAAGRARAVPLRRRRHRAPLRDVGGARERAAALLRARRRVGGCLRRAASWPLLVVVKRRLPPDAAHPRDRTRRVAALRRAARDRYTELFEDVPS